MKPGRELDALVAEKVMGWRAHTIWGTDYEVGSGGPVRRICYAPHYSTDIAAAWEVVQRMEDDDFWCKLTRKTYSRHPAHETDPMWECYLRCVRGGTRKGPVAAAETAPHAICLAAIRAVGVEVDDG